VKYKIIFNPWRKLFYIRNATALLLSSTGQSGCLPGIKTFGKENNKKLPTFQKLYGKNV
jgi:hypothetical protein